MNIWAEVALGASTTDSATSPPRLSPRQHCMIFFLKKEVLELGLRVLERSQWWAPCATSTLVQVQVQLGCRLCVLGLGLGELEQSPPFPAVILILLFEFIYNFPS